MGEEGGEGIVELQDEFARIEAAVDAGRTDLGCLGFWRLVREVKVEPALSHHWAEQIGRIDRKAFERSVRLRVPIWAGNLAFGVGFLVSAALGPAALALATSGRGTLAGLALVASAVGLSATIHSPAHLVVGRLLGIRFTHYFWAPGRFPPFPGVKIDYASYLRTPPGRRALMHAAGAIATKAAPFALLAGLGPLDGYRALPRWSLWAVTLYGVGQIVTDVLFSTKRSDWKKVRRERRLARAQIDRRR